VGAKKGLGTGQFSTNWGKELSKKKPEGGGRERETQEAKMQHVLNGSFCQKEKRFKKGWCNWSRQEKEKRPRKKVARSLRKILRGNRSHRGLDRSQRTVYQNTRLSKGVGGGVGPTQ